jgi:hypothetical protein
MCRKIQHELLSKKWSMLEVWVYFGFGYILSRHTNDLISYLVIGVIFLFIAFLSAALSEMYIYKRGKEDEST